MKSILAHDRYLRATVPLKRAVDALNLAARGRPGLTIVAEPGAQKLEPGNDESHLYVVRNPRFDPLQNPGTDDETDQYKSAYLKSYVDPRKAQWAETMKDFIRKEFVRATPTNDAMDAVESWLSDAIECDYPVYDAELRDLLCHVIVMDRTEGYTDADTTGTQMGSYRGEWRGGGFG